MQYIGSYFIFEALAYLGETIVHVPIGFYDPLYYFLGSAAIALVCNLYAIRKRKSMPFWLLVPGVLVILLGLFWFSEEWGSLTGFFDALGWTCFGIAMIWYVLRREKIEKEDEVQKKESIFMDQDDEKKKVDIF